jgi:hypothetical protein
LVRRRLGLRRTFGAGDAVAVIVDVGGVTTDVLLIMPLRLSSKALIVVIMATALS